MWKKLACLIIAPWLLLAGPAYAEEKVTTDSIIDAAKKADGEYAGLSLMRQMFGTAIDDPLAKRQGGKADDAGIQGTDVGAGILSEIFEKFNLALLALAMLYLTYNVTSGIAQTAQDGVFLGKNIQSHWVVIRLTAGITSMVPVFAGWSLAQLVVMWFAVIGTGIGNIGANAVGSYMASGGNLVYQDNGAGAAYANIADELFAMSVCAYSVSPKVGGIDLSRTKFEHGDYGICGKVRTPRDANGSAAYSNTNGLRESKINRAQGAYTQLANDMANHAAMVVKNHLDGQKTGYDPEVIRKAAQRYRKALNTVAQAKQKPGDDRARIVKENLKKEGFVGLGSYFGTLNKQGSTEFQLAGTMTPSIIQPAPAAGADSRLSEAVSEDYRLIMAKVEGTKARVNAPMAEAQNPGDSNGMLKLLMDAIVTDQDGDNECGSGPLSAGYWAGISRCGDKQNVMMTLQNIGTTGEAFTVTALGAMWGGYYFTESTTEAAKDSLLGKALASTGVGTVAVGAIVSGVKTMGKMAEYASYLLILMGGFFVMLAHYLPLVLYIAWIGAIISYLGSVIKGVVAAPLWSFAHLDTDGQGMGQRTQYGYLFLLEVTLRPILMVIGFVFAVMLIQIMGQLVFYTFPLAVSDAGTADGFFGSMVGTVVSLGVFVMLMVMIVSTCANIIHLLPDQVMLFMGQSFGMQGFGSNTNSDLKLATGALMGAGGKLGSDGMQKMNSARAGRAEYAVAERRHQELLNKPGGGEAGAAKIG